MIPAKSYTITPPAWVGHRQRASTVVSVLPDDCFDSMVTVDASHAQSWGQGFLDELCKQLMEVRSCKHVVFVGMSPRAKKLVENSWDLRGYPKNALTFVGLRCPPTTVCK